MLCEYRIHTHPITKLTADVYIYLQDKIVEEFLWWCGWFYSGNYSLISHIYHSSHCSSGQCADIVDHSGVL